MLRNCQGDSKPARSFTSEKLSVCINSLFGSQGRRRCLVGDGNLSGAVKDTLVKNARRLSRSKVAAQKVMESLNLVFSANCRALARVNRAESGWRRNKGHSYICTCIYITWEYNYPKVATERRN